MVTHIARIAGWTLATTLGGGLGAAIGFVFAFVWIWSQADGGEPFPLPGIINLGIPLIGGPTIAFLGWGMAQALSFAFFQESGWRPARGKWILATIVGGLIGSLGVFGINSLGQALSLRLMIPASIVVVGFAVAIAQTLTLRNSSVHARHWLLTNGFAALSGVIFALTTAVLLSVLDATSEFSAVPSPIIAVLAQGVALELWPPSLSKNC